MSFQKAPDTVIKLFREVIAETHDRLSHSRIAVIMADWLTTLLTVDKDRV